MKIKEVCDKTGLTERTVRYYEEEKLIAPAVTEKNGRQYRDYTEADVEQLLSVSTLRRLLFSVEEIRLMQQDPRRIPLLLKEYRVRLSDAHRRMGDVLSALEGMDLSAVRTAGDLARELVSAAAHRSLPPADITPNFGRFDAESEGEKARLLAEFKAEQERVEAAGKKWMKALVRGDVVLCVVTAVLDSVELNFSWIIGSILKVILLYYFYDSTRALPRVLLGIQTGLTGIINLIAAVGALQLGLPWLAALGAVYALWYLFETYMLFAHHPIRVARGEA